jgi:Skp family chaperone for outer membrane proteins
LEDADMIKQMRYAILAAGLSLFAGSAAGAQAAEEHKPGGLNKVAHDVSRTAKRAGRDTKAELKRGSSKTHNALTDAGNNTKAELKRATGIKAPQSHEPGGLNKVARDISKTSKKAGSDAKAEKNRVKSDVHGGLTETGKSVKDTTLKAKP